VNIFIKNNQTYVYFHKGLYITIAYKSSGESMSLFRVIEEHPNFVILENILGDKVLYERLMNTTHTFSGQGDILNLLHSIKQQHKPSNFVVEDSLVYSELKKDWFKLELEVTEDCNMRCGYCVYSGNYAREREHTLGAMTEDIALKAINLYAEHVQGGKANIGFWGGEPLLNVGLIKRVVEAGKEVFAVPMFHLTSNMLLAHKHAQYLAEENFFLTASLNGPKEINDDHRVTKGNLGTFDHVMNALDNIQNISPDFFERVMFSVVLTQPARIDEVRDFFRKHFEFNPIKLSMVSGASLRKPLEAYSKQNLELYAGKVGLLAEEYIQKVKSRQDVDPFLRSYFEPLVSVVRDRTVSRVNENLYPMGFCIPGQNKLFVNASGELGACSDTIGQMKIGDVHEGLDYMLLLRQIQQHVDYRNDLCLDCWAQRLCKNCFATAKDENGDLSYSGASNHCQTAKSAVLAGISLYSCII
jgi:uncharacterized protein